MIFQKMILAHFLLLTTQVCFGQQDFDVTLIRDTINGKEVFVGELKNIHKYKTLSFSNAKIHPSVSMVVISPDGSRLPNLSRLCGTGNMQDILPNQSIKSALYPLLLFQTLGSNSGIPPQKGIHKIYWEVDEIRSNVLEFYCSGEELNSLNID